MLLLFFLVCAGAAALDLSTATVVTAFEPDARERKAVAMLVEETARRSQIRWPVSKTAGPGPNITIARGSGPKEGYSLRVEAGSVRIEGNDSRGILFGIGRLLRAMSMERGRIAVPDSLRLTTAPRYPLRGHQLGYRPKTNSYDGWSLPVWEQYIRDLAVFGANAIELIPPRSDDDDDSPHFPASKIETMTGMSRICDDYGLDVWIWYPALDPDYSRPEQVDFALKEWAEVFRRLPRIDAVFVPGGDPGHTPPKHLMPLLEKQAASLRKFHPKAQMWVAPQGFSTAWLEEFYQILRTEPKWLDGVVFGPQIRVSLATLRAAVPRRYPIRHYPDITHTLRCQYPVPDWDAAFQLTLHREPINPRPLDQVAIFRHTQPHTVGFITYSEGCNDDVNKVVWSALGWDPDADVTEVLRDYARFFIGHRFTEPFARGLMDLEQNWRGPLAVNEGVYRTLAAFRQMDHDATPAQLANWRFQQAQYRAHYDAYTRSRLLYEQFLEDRAMDELRDAPSVGSLRAVARAEEILDRALSQRVSAPWRARVFELGEALFQSIRMQLSVEWYKAIAPGRGANLDSLDNPLNNRAWLLSRFAAIRALDSEKRRLEAISEILNWTNPGPGGFYDDLGNPAAQPHLVSGLPYGDDPARLVSPLAAAHPRPGEPWRLSWVTVAESRDDAPLRMRYTGLSRTAAYTLRVVYAGEDVPFEFRLLADGTHEIHGWRQKPKPVAPVEFRVPPEATADGSLSLEFQRKPGMGGAGRAVQVAEVWLTPR